MVQAVGAVTGCFIKDSINNWYKKINRSPLNPPDWVFPIAWTILYGIISVAGWMVQFADTTSYLTTIRVLYGIQLALNWSWSPIFFIKKWTGLALGIIIVMVAMTATIMGLSFASGLDIVGYLLIPYILWISFATHLNYYEKDEFCK